MSEFEPKSPLDRATSWGLRAGTFGFLYSVVTNALGQHSRGAAGVFTRSGGSITYFAAMGATYAFTEAQVSNMRQKDDPLNSAIGGMSAGFLAGLRARSLPTAFLGAAVGGITMGFFDYSGKFTGDSGWYDEERRTKFLKRPLDLSTTSSTE